MQYPLVMFRILKVQDPQLLVQVYRIDNTSRANDHDCQERANRNVNYFDTLDLDPLITAAERDDLKRKWFAESRLYRHAPNGLQHLTKPELIRLILSVCQPIQMVSFMYYIMAQVWLILSRFSVFYLLIKFNANVTTVLRSSAHLLEMTRNSILDYDVGRTICSI